MNKKYERKMRKLLVLSVVFALFLSACAEREFATEKPTDEEVQKVKEKALPIVKSLLTSLKSELVAAMQKGGPNAAIEVCNIKALPITDEVQEIAGENIGLKRVSRNFRNPKNAPDAIDEIALSQFEAVIASGEKIPDFFINKVKSLKGTDYYFYKSLKVDAVCLNCHGDAAQMDAGLLEKINQLYPNDKAKGYKAVDFRGLVRVKLKEL